MKTELQQATAASTCRYLIEGIAIADTIFPLTLLRGKTRIQVTQIGGWQRSRCHSTS